MKKIVNRSLAVTILAIGIIAGLLVYITRFCEQGENWALYFPGTGDSVEGSIYDRGGNLLASFNADEQRYSATAEESVPDLSQASGTASGTTILLTESP